MVVKREKHRALSSWKGSRDGQAEDAVTFQ